MYESHYLSDIYKSTGQLDSFGQLLDNLFRPLFQVTVDPSSNPQLHCFLQQVRGNPSMKFACII